MLRIRYDSMVLNWLLNSIDPSLSRAFICANCYRIVIERFSQSNGPLLYKVQKEILKLYQGNDSVVVFDAFESLLQLWYKLVDLSKIPH